MMNAIIHTIPDQKNRKLQHYIGSDKISLLSLTVMDNLQLYL